MDNAILNKLMNLLISLARDVVPPLIYNYKENVTLKSQVWGSLTLAQLYS